MQHKHRMPHKQLMLLIGACRAEYSKHCSGWPNRVSSRSFFEEKQIVTLRPGIDRCFETKTGGAQFLDCDIFGNAVSATVCGDTLYWIKSGTWSEFDNGEATARF